MSHHPGSRSHILSQRVDLTSARADLEVPVFRRAPPVDDRLDLDQPIPEPEAPRGLPVASTRVALDGNRKGVAHLPKCTPSLQPQRREADTPS